MKLGGPIWRKDATNVLEGVVHAFSCFFSLQNFLISSKLPNKKMKPRKKRKGEGKTNYLSLCFLSH